MKEFIYWVVKEVGRSNTDLSERFAIKALASSFWDAVKILSGIDWLRIALISQSEIGFSVKYQVERLIPQLKYYAFDWDDNIFKMPTKIYLRRLSDWEEVEVWTSEYAEIMNNDESVKEFELLDWEESFRDFRETADDKFIKEALLAQPGPSLPDFVECINNAKIFSIITTRWHSENAYETVIAEMIRNNMHWISSKAFMNNFLEHIRHAEDIVWDKDFDYQEAIKANNDNDLEWFIERYVQMCRFYPVKNNAVCSKLGIITNNVAKLKVKALQLFSEYVHLQSFKLENKWLAPRNIWFSDDDDRFVSAAVRFYKKKVLALTWSIFTVFKSWEFSISSKQVIQS